MWRRVCALICSCNLFLIFKILCRQEPEILEVFTNEEYNHEHNQLVDHENYFIFQGSRKKLVLFFYCFSGITKHHLSECHLGLWIYLWFWVQLVSIWYPALLHQEADHWWQTQHQSRWYQLHWRIQPWQILPHLILLLWDCGQWSPGSVQFQQTHGGELHNNIPAHRDAAPDQVMCFAYINLKLLILVKCPHSSAKDF